MSQEEFDHFTHLVVVGMFLDAPPPNSVQDTCGNCGRVITLGPDSQRLIASAQGREVSKRCMPCVILENRGQRPPPVYRAKDYLETRDDT